MVYLRQLLYFGIQHNYIMHIFNFAHRTSKRHALMGLDLIKLVNFIAFSRTFLIETLPPVAALAGKNTRLLVQFGTIAFIPSGSMLKH